MKSSPVKNDQVVPSYQLGLAICGVMALAYVPYHLIWFNLDSSGRELLERGVAAALGLYIISVSFLGIYRHRSRRFLTVLYCVLAATGGLLIWACWNLPREDVAGWARHTLLFPAFHFMGRMFYKAELERAAKEENLKSQTLAPGKS